MDDPWGSPWAEEVPPDEPIITKQNHDLPPSSTTQTPTKAPTLEQNANSPWGNDTGEDDFGAWSSMPTAEVLGLSFDEADEEWTKNAGEDGGSAEPSSISLGWAVNDRKPDVQRLAPNALLNSSIRQPSPDPWATEFALSDIQGKEVEHLQMVDEELTVVETSEASLNHEKAQSPDASLGINDYRTTAELEEDEEIAKEATEPAAEHKLPEVDPVSSRPSYSPSEGSLHEGPQHESPRTSMDEEPKRPQMPRKASSKVQELVEHFDGMVKEEEESISNISQNKSLTNINGNSEEDVDDFGDFEEGHSDLEEDTKDGIEEEVLVEATEKRPATPVTASSVSLPQTPKKDILPQRIISPNRTPKTFFGPVEIDPDLSMLEQLYPSSETKDQGSIFIPDTIPSDSFSSTEQRKTWYRISRYGPMRKHNSGDDENYIRVKWLKSQMRDDTLKIVARWMEEDRLSGQVILGGAGKTSSIFGWNDAKAPALPLSTAFAPKARANSRPALASIPTAAESPAVSPVIRSPLSPQRQSSTASTHTRNDSRGTPVSPVANFGWNAPVEAQSSHIVAPLLLSKPIIGNTQSSGEAASPVRLSTSSFRPLPLSDTITATESPQRTPLPIFESRSSPKPDVAPSPVANSIDVDEDDDWGDLVSSPVVSVTPAFPHPKVLKHKKSQSLMTPPPSTIQPSSWLNEMKSVIRPKSSFDDTMIPQSQNLVTSNTSPASLSAFGISPNMAFPPQGSSSNPLTQVVTGQADPWDLSFFESIPAPQPTPAQTKLSLAKSKMGTAAGKSVAPSNIPALEPPSRLNHKAREEAEQDRIVQSIVTNLPDLSYMLRK